MTVINKEISVNAPRETVWQYLEDPDLLAAWLMRNDFKPEAGSEFRFYGQPGGDWDGVLHCKLVEFDPPGKIAFTWNANDIGTDTLVTIELTEQGDMTHIRLLHANFDQAPRDIEAIVSRHEAGWADHLRVLATQIMEEERGAQPTPRLMDWTSFDLHVAIDAAPDRVLAAWSTVNGMEGFFVEMMRITGPDGGQRQPDEPAQAGDRFVWRWHNGRRVMGEYLAPESQNEIRFTFGDSKVRVSATPFRNGSLVRLEQYDIPDSEESKMHVYVNCRAAWVYFLTVLKVLLEHGIDGRDKTRETGASFSTYFDPANIGAQ